MSANEKKGCSCHWKELCHESISNETFLICKLDTVLDIAQAVAIRDVGLATLEVIIENWIYRWENDHKKGDLNEKTLEKMDKFIKELHDLKAGVRKSRIGRYERQITALEKEIKELEEDSD